MRFTGWRRWLGAATLGAGAMASAQAGSISFDDVSPTLFSGSAVSSGGYSFASTGAGFSGVDNSAAFSMFGNAPGNDNGQYLFALNGDGIVMSYGGEGFYVDGFSASFLAPMGGLASDVVAGGLLLTATLLGGGTATEFFDLPASDKAGNFSFGTMFTSTLRGQALASLTFTSCVYMTDGSCSFAAGALPAQFALDEVQLPEPASLALAVGALGVAGMVRRRRAAAV